jgi:hypothetical protein
MKHPFCEFSAGKGAGDLRVTVVGPSENFRLGVFFALQGT